MGKGYKFGNFTLYVLSLIEHLPFSYLAGNAHIMEQISKAGGDLESMS